MKKAKNTQNFSSFVVRTNILLKTCCSPETLSLAIVKISDEWVLYTGFKRHSLCALIDVSEFWNSWPDTRKRLIDLIVSFVLNVWFSPKCSYNCWLLKNLQTYHKRINASNESLRQWFFKIRPAWFDTVLLNQNCTLGIFLI